MYARIIYVLLCVPDNTVSRKNSFEDGSLEIDLDESFDESKEMKKKKKKRRSRKKYYDND